MRQFSWRSDLQGTHDHGQYWTHDTALRLIRAGDGHLIYFDPDYNGTTEWPTSTTEN